MQLLALRLGCETAEVSSVLYKMENEAKGKITRNVSGNSEAEKTRIFVGRVRSFDG
jgi:ParB family transcriptional regulator, chromosome partitioning protein